MADHTPLIASRGFHKLAQTLAFAAIALMVALVAACSAQPTMSAGADGPAEATKKRCKYVVKRVRGKKRRVRVCRNVPTPRPQPPPAAAPSAVIARINVGAHAWIVTAAEDGSVWSNGAAGVVRIDPASNAITVRTQFEGSPSAGAGSVWITTERTLRRLNPATGAVIAEIALPQPGEWALAFPDAVWVTAPDARSLVRVDPLSKVAVATVPACDVKNYGLTEAGGSIWAACFNEGEVLRIDPATNRIVARVAVGVGAHHVASGAGSVWVTNRETGALSRIDVATNTVVATIRTSINPAIVFAQDAVWATADSSVLKIDPATNRIVGRLPVDPGEYYGLAYAAGSLWLSTIVDQRVLRLDPARLQPM